MKLSVLFPDESEHEREVPRDLHLDRGTVGPAGAKAGSVQRRKLVLSFQLPSTCVVGTLRQSAL